MIKTSLNPLRLNLWPLKTTVNKVRLHSDHFMSNIIQISGFSSNMRSQKGSISTKSLFSNSAMSSLPNLWTGMNSIGRNIDYNSTFIFSNSTTFSVTAKVCFKFLQGQKPKNASYWSLTVLELYLWSGILPMDAHYARILYLWTSPNLSLSSHD